MKIMCFLFLLGHISVGAYAHSCIELRLFNNFQNRVQLLIKKSCKAEKAMEAVP